MLSIITRARHRFSLHVAKLKKVLHISVEHQLNGISILLPADHLLPSYQRSHANYDRFLPHLVRFLGEEDTIVDVGANVGDTLASMVASNAKPTYVCIEPDDTFFSYLSRNIARIRAQVHSNVRIIPVRSLVGKTVTGVELEGNGGTKHAVISGVGRLRSRSLDALLAELPVSNIRLIKSDVDGFDYDVIESAVSVISSAKPLIFFECHQDFLFQKRSYEAAMRSLEATGYVDWTVFDNFGAVVLRTGDLSQVTQLIEYVWAQNAGRASRTIHYYDILVASKNDSEMIDKVLREYS